MYELNRLTEKSFYIESPAKVGVFLPEEGRAFLIDSGSDKDAGKKIKKALDGQGWKLEAVFNTHSHADHIGGNQYLQKQTGCPVYAAGIEQAFTCHPLLEPAFLYGGDPAPELRHKFLMAQPSDALLLTEAVLPCGLEALPLPGHSFDMVGFRTDDGVVYLADCLSSEQTLEKYRISFLADVAASLQTLEAVEKLEADWFVPAHAPATRDIRPLVRLNIRLIHEIGQRICELCKEPLSFEQLLQKLFSCYGLTMNYEQYVLVGSTVRSYLTWLKNAGSLQTEIDDNRWLWRSL